MNTKLVNEPVTIIHRGIVSQDSHRNDIRGDVGSTSTVGYYEQTDATEILVGRDMYTANGRMFLPPDTPITAIDAVQRAGVTHEVVGDPAAIYNPRTRTVHHIEVRLRATSG